MAIVITSNSGKTHYALQQYVCDTNADIIDLPVDNVWVGSTAFVIDSGETYMLNSALNWVKVDLGGGGGGGGSSEDIKTVAENFAPPYDETQTYSVGDLVVYNYVLYKCITAVSTPEEFDDTKWEHTTLESSFEIDDNDTSAVKTWSSSKLSEITLPDATNNDKNKLISVDASGNYELRNTIDIGRASNSTVGTNSTAEGSNTIASGNYSHAEGTYTKATGAQSHVEGRGGEQYVSEAHGQGAHVEGYSQRIPQLDEQGHSGYSYLINKAWGNGAHAEGSGTMATGNYSHAEGKAYASDINGQVINTYALGEAAHAEGLGTQATGEHSHSEGELTTASGNRGSHAEGSGTVASGATSHAEGSNTTASGSQSHAEGYSTTANHKSQHVFGEYNILDANAAAVTARGDYIEIVGNGTASNARSNARTLDWSGNETLAGKLTVGAQPTAANDVTTKQYVDAISTDITNVTNTVNNLLAPQTTKIYEFDFTDSLVDKIGGTITATLSGNASQSSNGITLTNGQVNIPGIANYNRIYEVEFGACNINVPHNYASVFSYQGSNYYDIVSSFGLQNNEWGFWDYIGDYHCTGVGTGIVSNNNIFNNGKLKVIFITSSSASVYINDNFIGTYTLGVPLTQDFIRFGSADYKTSVNSIVIKKLTVYSGVESGEDILGRIGNLEANALPAVTSSDNGKVLQVVSGAWTAVDLNGNNIQY